MPFSFNGLQYIVGTPETVEGMQALKALRPFDDAVIAFLNDLSGELRKIREYPDVATVGFWCRKAALMQEKAKIDDAGERFGKGIVFHSTPSNVPVNFAFSFAAGLLAGFDRSFAVRYSFLLSFPAVLCACLLKLIEALRCGFDRSLLLPCLAGAAAAALAGLPAIRLVRSLTQRGKLRHFAYYCWALGLSAIIATLVV